MSFRLLLCIGALIATEAKAASLPETYYEVGYEDGYAGNAPSASLSRNVAYRDGYNVGREQR